MKSTISIILTAAFCVLALAAVAVAQEPVDVAKAGPGYGNAPVSSRNLPAYIDEDLASKHAHFTRFAKGKLKAFDRNHTMSKQRMQITRMPNGMFQARYKAVDHSSMICTVKRSKSKVSPYVGVVRFYEFTYEAVGLSRKAVRSADFRPVKKKRNRHIFSFVSGRWQ